MLMQHCSDWCKLTTADRWLAGFWDDGLNNRNSTEEIICGLLAKENSRLKYENMSNLKYLCLSHELLRTDYSEWVTFSCHFINIFLPSEYNLGRNGARMWYKKVCINFFASNFHIFPFWGQKYVKITLESILIAKNARQRQFLVPFPIRWA